MSNKKSVVLPLAAEIEGCGIECDNARNVTRQLDYYKNLGVTESNYSGAIKKNGTSAYIWWLRTAFSSYATGFFRVNISGNWANDYANFSYGVAPAFRLR